MQTSAVGHDVKDEFDRVYREHGARLWRSLLLYTGRPEIASDASAEAFAQAIGRWEELRDPLAWIWRVAFRIAARELKAERQPAQLPGDLSYEMQEPITDLLRALETLTLHQRASITLHYYAGYSHREVAAILGSSTSAIGVHIHRGKKRLREALEVRDG